MKKIALIYFFSIVTVLIINYFISFNIWDNRTTLDLPEKINVYFDKEQTTREVDFEDYLVGVVSAEVPAEFEEEAIKAQAVAARTYIYNKYKKFTKDPNLAPLEHKESVVCTNSKHCCAYYSKEDLLRIHGQDWMNKYYNKICNVVSDTKGEVIMYDNEPIIAVFHSSSGGNRTENSGDVWSSNLPYLTSVESAGEDKRDGYNTIVNVSADDFKTKLEQNRKDFSLGNDRNKWIGDITYTDGNSVKTIKIGNSDFKGTEIRSIFGLRSACFEISMLNDTVTFNVHGYGHGVGMSQHGANIMAKSGKGYKDILKWYYTGVEIIK